MEILLFTIFASILLVAGFVAFFVYTQKNPDADADRDSLLPLEDEQQVDHTPPSNKPLPQVSTLKKQR